MITRILTDKEYKYFQKAAKIAIPFATVTRSRRLYSKGKVEIDCHFSRMSYDNPRDSRRADAVNSLLEKFGMVHGSLGFSGIEKVVCRFSLTDGHNAENNHRAYNTQYVHRVHYALPKNQYMDILHESTHSREAHSQYADCGLGL